jgi:hypothetical protein
MVTTLQWRSFMAKLGAVLIALLLLAGCRSMSDVKPGDGQVATITGKSYDEVWAAALRVSGEHFEIREQDKAAGAIRAEREQHFMETAGDWVGVFITPPREGSPTYNVEVVHRKKNAMQLTGQDWEKKVLRDIQDDLAGRPKK